MKTLIFGIDGLGSCTLTRLGLNKLSDRIAGGVVGNPAVDNVISRGWVDIYTGKSAYESGGFYQVPQLSRGKILPSQNTGISTVTKAVGEETLLWNRLKEKEQTVGLFTVPTVTKPACGIDFSIAATGGGRFDNSISTKDIHPAGILDGSKIGNIDLGLRMGYGAFLPDSLTSLELMANKHISDYFYTLRRTIERTPVDTCFAASRFINEMGYKFLGLFSSDIESKFESDLKDLVAELCSNFDAELSDFIDWVNPENLFIVSDHGIGDFKFDVNINEVLVGAGLLNRDSSIERLLKTNIRNCLNKVNPKKYSLASPKYDFGGAKYFSIGYMNAIFMNDERFLTRVADGVDREAETDCFIEHLNNHLKEQNFDIDIGFTNLEGGFMSPSIGGVPTPSVRCNLPSGSYNSEKFKCPVKRRFVDYEKMFSHGFSGEVSGGKSEDTIAAYVGSNTEGIRFDKLTDIYQSILSVK